MKVWELSNNGTSTWLYTWRYDMFVDFEIQRIIILGELRPSLQLVDSKTHVQQNIVSWHGWRFVVRGNGMYVQHPQVLSKSLVLFSHVLHPPQIWQQFLWIWVDPQIHTAIHSKAERLFAFFTGEIPGLPWDSTARGNDGSPAAFFYAPPQNGVWHIHLEGGWTMENREVDVHGCSVVWWI